MGKGWKAMAILGGIVMLVTGLALVGWSTGSLTPDLIQSKSEACPVCGFLCRYTTPVATIGGGILFFIPLLALYMGHKKRARQRSVPCGPPDQRIDVTLSCVRDGIKGVASQVPDIAWVQANIYWRGRTPNLLVRVGMNATRSVQEAASSLQNSVRSYVNDVLGVVEMGEVRLIIEKIEAPARPTMLEE